MEVFVGFHVVFPLPSSPVLNPTVHVGKVFPDGRKD